MLIEQWRREYNTIRPRHWTLPINNETWILRRFGAIPLLATGSNLDEMREVTFSRLRGSLPCALRIPSDPFEEWQLLEEDGEWERLAANSPSGQAR